MKLFVPLLLLFSAASLPLHSTAQKNNSKTLHWRISGNGLQKPSYLFGTMHLKDRRLFFFGDSVYTSLASAEGFAMELDPNEMMDSIFSKMGEADTTTLIRKLMDDKKFSKVSKKLEKKFGMPAEKISRRQLISERETWYYKLHKADDMNTVVDLYLYDIARKQGKWVGGIEDVTDQWGIKDELGKDIDIDEYIEEDNDAIRKQYLEQMIRIYSDQDIAGMDEWMNRSQSQTSRDLLLVNRNRKMADRMDSLAHIRNSFFAVGAAHLPGETGLIRLLQKKGFSVEPVFSSKKINPANYTYTAKEIAWVKFAEPDSAYTVEMPGKASDLKIAEDVVKFKVCADVVTNSFYMTGYSLFSTDENPEALTDRMVRSFLSRGFEKKEEKKITNKGVRGTEVMAVMSGVFYRIQVFPFPDKVFIVMAGVENRDKLNARDVDRFFGSFTMNAALHAKPNKWENYTNSSKGFAVAFPKKPGVDKLKAGEAVKNVETTTYTAFDVANSAYYLVVVNETKRGYVMNDDSVVFNEKLNYYRQNEAIIRDNRHFHYGQNAAMSFSAQTARDGIEYVTKILVICRGNRNYTIFTVTQKGHEDYPDITRFFRSFELLPYQDAPWTTASANGNAFTTWAPSSFERLLPDTTGMTEEEAAAEWTASNKTVQFLAHDPNSATSFNVNVKPLSKYYSAKTDSLFLDGQIRLYFSDTASEVAQSNPGQFDSLVYRKEVFNGKVRGVEVLVKNGRESHYKRVRILPHGDSSYHLFTLASKELITGANGNRFFEDFRFAEEDLPSGVLKNKTALLLSDLGSSDSLSSHEASEAIRDFQFEPGDLPLLHLALLKNYPSDTSGQRYHNSHEKISAAITKLHDSSTVAFIANNYVRGTQDAPELKMIMLTMLANNRTTTAMGILKQLLLRHPPTGSSPDQLIYALSDSLALSASMFPEAASFFSDSLLGPGMLRLASQLVDSNLVESKILLEHRDAIHRTANRELAILKQDAEGYSYNHYHILEVLGKLRDNRSVALLNEYLRLDDIGIKQKAALTLLKIQQKVSPAEIRKVAADNAYRTYFYTSLREIGKQALFPVAFLTQQEFAKGYLYGYSSADEQITSFKLVGEKVSVIKGRKARFYLFKMSSEYEGETASYLGICGPFDLDRKKIELDENDLFINIFFDQPYSAANVDTLYKDFIKYKTSEAGLPAGQ